MQITPLVLIMLHIHSRDVGWNAANEDWDCLLGGEIFFDFPFLISIPVDLPVFLHVSFQVQLHLPFAFLNSSLENWTSSLYSSQATCPCLYSLCTCFFLFRFPRVPYSPLPVLPPLFDFLLLVIASSCTLLKVSSKICQLCYTPLSLRAFWQGIWLIVSLESWYFAFLQFRCLTLFLTWFISLRTANSTSACSLQPRLSSSVLMSLISSFILVFITSSIASTLLGLSITWLKRLFSFYSRSFLDCLHLTVLLFWHMSEWFKFLSRKSLKVWCLQVQDTASVLQCD